MAGPKKHKSELIDKIKREMDPFVKRRSQTRLVISALICDAIKKRGISKSALAELMRASPSEVTRWTSGYHNFTADTISDLEMVLGISIFNRSIKSLPTRRMECKLVLDVSQPSNLLFSETTDIVTFGGSKESHFNRTIYTNGGMQATALNISTDI